MAMKKSEQVSELSEKIEPKTGRIGKMISTDAQVWAEAKVLAKALDSDISKLVTKTLKILCALPVDKVKEFLDRE